MIIQIHNKPDLIEKQSVIIENVALWICGKLNLPMKQLDIIFIDDEELRTMHKQYLNDNTFTDVMTFNLGERDSIEGELYISTARIQENATIYNVSFINELCRLIIHGCLHLYGYDDNDEVKRKLMKEKEEDYLSQAVLNFIN